ncbi:hypothetical protein C0Q44_27135 [Paenibacillus sp. PCH8]|uniref:DUF7674 family protein n=1 Tax=Paenibacillus sp. PCH8 TaxID=2066524 RepID=UPI000CF85977|nr:hypothetical protein [Paenibacillus sp. PCH8]PQP80459.1 hypothetical protein C0Q44_27135 [Paenibacillus sp. PCH8]
MKYENLIERLLTAVPQIRPYYEEEIEWLEEDLPHVIFGMVVTPFLIKYTNEQKDISNLYDFLEDMALSEEKVQEVLVVSVLESLITEREIIETAKSYMGDLTRKICETTQKAYGY